MADIVGESFYDLTTQTFGVPANLPKFQNAYMAAVNMTLQRMKVVGDMRTAPDRLTTTEGDIDLDDKYEFCLWDGVFYHLVMFGYKPRQQGPNKPVSMVRALDVFELSLNRFVMELHHTEQATNNQDTIGGRDLS